LLELQDQLRGLAARQTGGGDWWHGKIAHHKVKMEGKALEAHA